MLTDRQINNAKPKEKAYKLNDAKGLYLYVTPKGTKSFRLDFALHGKRSTLTIGKYPTISLSEARIMANDALKQIANGINPAEEKQKAKEEHKQAQLNTFYAIATQWHQYKTPKLNPNHAKRIWATLEKDVFSEIGLRPVTNITVKDVKAVLDKVISRGALVTAEKIREWIGSIFKYANMLEITDRNPAVALSGYITQNKTAHMPVLPREQITEFYSLLSQTNADKQNIIAIMLIMLVFVRSNELRGAMWNEINWNERLWNIPAERMKMKLPHTVPLSDWAMDLLHELHGITGKNPYLFPSGSKRGYISENTLGKIINNMGYKGMATPHGFRSLASTILNENRFTPNAIEVQLSHTVKSMYGTAYNKSDYIEERIEMMQWYSDYLRRHYDAALAIIQAA